MKRRWGRLAIILSAAFILLVAGALLFLQTPLASRLILEQTRKHLRSRYRIDLAASSVRINVFRGSATLEDAVVQSTTAKDIPPLFKANRIHVNAGVISILRGTIELEELTIAKPEIHYYVRRDGRSNLPEFPPSSGPAPEYRILEAKLQNGSVRIEDLSRNLDVTLPRWQIRLYFERKAMAHWVDFTTRLRGDLKLEDRAVPIESASFQGILRTDSLDLKPLKIAAAASTIEVSGKVERFSRPELELEARPDLNLNRLGEIFDIGTPIAGRLSGKIAIKGMLDDLTIAAQLKGTGVSGGPYRNTRFDLETLAALSPHFLTLNQIGLRSPAGALNGVAQLSLKPQSGANSFSGRLRNLDLQPIAALAGASFNLASRASGRISLGWKGKLAVRALNGRAHLELAATRATPERDVLPLSGTVSARIISGDISGVLQEISTMGVRATGAFSLRNLRTIDAAVDGSAENLGELTPHLSRFLGADDPTLVGVELAGPLQFSSRVSGGIGAHQKPLIKVSAETPELRAGELRNLAMKADAAIEGDLVTFDSAVTLPENATIAARGSIDIGHKTPVLTLAARTESLPLASLLSAAGSRIPAEGAIKAELHIEGPTNALSGSGVIAADGLSVYQEPVGSFKTEVKLASGEIASDRFRIIRNPLNPTTDFVDASFSYGIESGRYAFEAVGKQLHVSAKTLPGGDALNAPFDLIASGEGVVSDPSLRLKITAQDVRVRERSFGPLSMTASLEAGKLTVDADAPTINLTSRAEILSKAPHQFTTEMRLSDPDLSLLGLKAPHGQPITGTIDISLKGEGDLEHLEQMRGSAEIGRLQLHAGTEEVHTEAPITAEYTDGMIELLTPATLVSGRSRLEINGKAALRKEADNSALSLKGQLDLEQAARLAPLPEGLAVAGVVDIDIAARGGFKRLRPSGSILLSNGNVKIPELAVPLSNIGIRAELRDDALVLERADALLGEGAIALTGEFPFGLLPERLPLARAPRPARFELDLKNLKPENTGLVPDGVSGLVSLHASGRAARPDLRALNAEIEFGDLGLKINDVALTQKGTSRIVVRDGELAVSRLTLLGDQTSIEASGTAGLLPDSPMRLKLTGDFNAALLTFMDQDVKAAGTVRVEIAALGSRNAPRLNGTATMSNGRVSIRSPRIVADSLRIRLDLTPNQITVQEFKGTLNGGSLTVAGAAGYRRGTVNDVNLTLKAEDFFLNFPEGLKSASNADLTIVSKEDAIVIGGTVRVAESSYRESLELSGQLMSFLNSQKVLEENKSAASPLLDRVRFDITLRTTTPLLVQNNIAKVEASANLRVTGPFKDPAAIGRITLTEGGEIVLNQRKFYINRGSIMLNDQNEIRPELDIQAQTKVESYGDKSSDMYSEEYVITVRLTGPPEKLTTAVSSEPQLSEQDAMSMLLTGRLTRTDRGGQMQMAQTQALSLLAGQAGEEVTREAREALRLSTFRIDPALVSSQSEPGARLTVGEDITKDLSLAYSMNLTDGGQQIWIAEYDITRQISTQATKQENNSYRFELRHDLRFGGASRSNRRSRQQATRATKFTIGSITFEGEPQVPEKTLLDRFKLEPGDRYDFQKVQKGLDRLHGLYAGQKRLEADVRLRRDTEKETVNLNVSIDPGPVVDFSFQGTTLSSDVRENVERAWRDAVFDTERIEDSSKAIRRALIDKGFLQPKVAPSVAQEGEKKTVQFLIDAGARYQNVAFEFPGASGIGAGTLNAILDRGELRLDVYDAPRKVADYLRGHYREHGYLQAVVALPQLQLNPETRTGKVSIPIEEGPQFVIGDLEFTGNASFGYDQLWSVIPTSTGSFYDPNTLQDAVRAIENTYRGSGYNDVSVAYRVVQDVKAAQAHVTFEITERRQSIVREIEIEGNHGVSREFIERQLAFKTGAPLDFNRISETRRRLYSTGVFTSADFQNEEIAHEPGAPESKEKNMRVRLRVRENRPYRVQYGALFDTERGPGGLVEAQNLNFLGRAALLGARVRYDSDLKEGRLYFNQPFVTNNFLKMDASVFALKEDRPGFSANRIGFSIFRERELARKYVLHYGYQYDHVRWNGLPPDPTLFQASDPVARLVATVTRDTRDSILDATRGEFTSHSLEFGPRFLGSEVGFTRYSGQYFRYVPLDRYFGMPTKDKEGKPLPTRFVYAGAMRLGLTSAFGGHDTISPERFFAGGGTTMRGFRQDLLGPTEMVDVQEGSSTTRTERPLGGEALFLFNNEIRFPITGILQGVGFLDIGNVYRRVSDFDFTMRKTAGFGVRVKIKFIPLRFDYGFKLDRRPGESPGEFFFSIGQAF